MTPAQLTTFKAHILANAGVAALLAANNHIAIAADYNQPGTGVIYRPSIPAAELNTAVVWSEYAALTVAFQNCYQAMIAAGSVDGSNANIRTGFATIFAGAGGLNTRTNLVAVAQRVPTKFEQVFTVANMCSVFGQTVTPNDVAQALGA